MPHTYSRVKNPDAGVTTIGKPTGCGCRILDRNANVQCCSQQPRQTMADHKIEHAAAGLHIQWGATFEAYLFFTHLANDTTATRYLSTTPIPLKRKRGAKIKTEVSLSTTAELNQLLSSETHAVNPIFLREDYAFDKHLPAIQAWHQQLSVLDAGTAENALISLCTSEFDDKQLEFNRTTKTSNDRIPDCCYKTECVANRILGVNKPLQQFLTPSEQRQVDEAEHPIFETDAACLLCIRHIHESMQKVRGALLLNPQAEIGRAHMTVPPFKNIVNQPGGYKRSAMALTPEDQTSLGIFMVGTSGTLRLALNPVTGREYIDQEALKYTARPDFQGGTAA